jgi:hypothetical protein
MTLLGFWSIFLAILLLLFVLTAAYGFVIWIRRRRYTRERFAFVALSAIVTLSLAVFASMSANLMPWYIGAALTRVIFKVDVPMPVANWTDYGFLFLAYLVAVWNIRRLHSNWAGLKSVEQYNREQRSESSSVFVEGLSEARRIAHREEPPEPYQSPNPRQFIAQLEPVTDSLAWKDQARELIRFSSSSYGFDAETGWHDKEGCWVGQNVNNGDLVVLYPSQSGADGEQIKTFVEYAHKLAGDRDASQVELIVAVRGATVPSVTQENGMRVRVESEAALLDRLVDFTDYRNEIRKRVQVNRLPDSAMSLNDVYVPSQFFQHQSRTPTDDVEQYLLKWLGEPGQRQLAMLGGYGQGKSTTALMCTHHLLEQAQPSRIPILIELRGTSPRNLTPLGLLATWAAPYQIKPQALMRLHIAGRLFLIFEGFDEMALVGDMQLRLDHFKMLWQFCYPQAKILITGRPNFFLDEQEMKAALGISEPRVDRPYCEDIRLAPFGLDHIAQSLRAHKPLVREQICTLAAKNARFLDLVSRPSLLHIVSVLWEREKLWEKVDQLTSAYVMKLFVEHSYRRQGLKQNATPGFMALTQSEREFFMSAIASYMAAQRLPNQIAGNQLNELIEKLIEGIPDAISTKTSAMAGETTQPLRQRLANSPEHGVEHVKTDVRACGLLVDDPAAPGTFRFGHKSFMEYLFADVLAEIIQDENSLKARAILAVTNARLEHITMLSVSVNFLSELLKAGKFNPELFRISHDKIEISEYIQRVIARRLLNTIYAGNALFNALQRLLIFDRTCRESMLRLKSPWKYIAVFFSPLPLLMSLSTLAVLSIDTPFDSINHKSSFFVEISRVLFALSILLTITVMPAAMARMFPERRLGLWEYLCKQIGITDSVMHKIVGTWYVPWARTQTFDYFSEYLFENASSANSDPQEALAYHGQDNDSISGVRGAADSGEGDAKVASEEVAERRT